MSIPLKDIFDSTVTKIVAVVISSLITMITWFIKVEISEMSSTLKEIQTDVQEVNQKNMLLEQKFELSFQSLEFKVNSKIENLENKVNILLKEKERK